MEELLNLKIKIKMLKSFGVKAIDKRLSHLQFVLFVERI